MKNIVLKKAALCLNLCGRRLLVPLLMFSSFFGSLWASDEGIPEALHSTDATAKRFQDCRYIFRNEHSIIHACNDTLLHQIVVVKYFRPGPKNAFENELFIFQKTAGLSRSLKLLDAVSEGAKKFLVIEYAHGGDFFDYIKTASKQKKPINVRRFFSQMVKAVAELHSRGVAHMDIKTENFFVTIDEKGEEQLKIGDFGYSLYMTSETERVVLISGTLMTMAPEILKTREMAKKRKDQEAELKKAQDSGRPITGELIKPLEIIPRHNPFFADMYSLAVVLYNTVCDGAPYGHAADDDALYLYMRVAGIEKLTLVLKQRMLFSSNAMRLLKRMMVIEPTMRPSAKELLKDRWLNPSHEEKREKTSS